ncbi:MAG: adenylate/guanylate cyclase domain-containing protein [Cyanobacteria bacterium J06638_28]
MAKSGKAFAGSRQLRRGIGYLSAVAGLALGYRLLIVLIYQIPLPMGIAVHPIWPPAAYTELSLLLFGLKFWPAVTLGSLLNSALSGSDAGVSVMAAMNNTLQAVLAVWLLRRVDFSLRIDRIRDVGSLLFLGALIPSTLSATIGMLTCCLANMTSWSDFGLSWFTWWMGNVGGILIWVPTILILLEYPHKLFIRQDYSLLWVMSLSLMCWSVLAAPYRMAIAPFPLEYLPYTLILLGAIRFGRPGAALSILITTGFAVWGFIQEQGPFFLSTEPQFAILALQAYVCVVVITVLALTASVEELEKARLELQAEQEKSEQLLLNILPQPITTRLKQDNHTTIADHFAEATVLFADIVNFTRLSTELSAQELVAWLNEIFSIFDDLADKHGLEKIKTIGDAYMVAGGLPEHRDDHAIAIAEMALDMQAALMEFRQKHDRPFTMRIGINTGPVVAGVIGKRKFIYDLWGDTVNTASRMESSGIAGEIQVTPRTYDVLQHRYHFEKRGSVAVKGKGQMETYLLRERKEVQLGV